MRHTKSSRPTLRALVGQIFLAISVAQARNGAPPSCPERTWSPPNLANYERDLAAYHSRTAEGGSRVSIDPRKVYNLAELIDIAERNNPETRVAWERARQAAAAVGLSESAYYPSSSRPQPQVTTALSFRFQHWQWIRETPSESEP